MEKTDVKKQFKELYRPGTKEFVLVDVPEMQILMIDGEGSPDSQGYSRSIQWLYSVVYPIKFIAKKAVAKDFVAPPLEALWWADDMDSYLNGDKDLWKWRAFMVVPDWVDGAMFDEAVEKASTKLGDVPQSLRLASFDEGLCVQIMHIGPYSEEAPTIARMHNEFLPANDLVRTGLHHEIYISDPRKSAPEKLKTVLRQPVRRK